MFISKRSGVFFLFFIVLLLRCLHSLHLRVIFTRAPAFAICGTSFTMFGPGKNKTPEVGLSPVHRRFRSRRMHSSPNGHKKKTRLDRHRLPPYVQTVQGLRPDTVICAQKISPFHRCFHDTTGLSPLSRHFSGPEGLSLPLAAGAGKGALPLTRGGLHDKIPLKQPRK